MKQTILKVSFSLNGDQARDFLFSIMRTEQLIRYFEDDLSPPKIREAATRELIARDLVPGNYQI